VNDDPGRSHRKQLQEVLSMEVNTQEIKTPVSRTPAESLALQVDLLEAIRESLDNQQRVVMHLAQQQQTQAEQLLYLSEALLPDAERKPGHQWVKVQDVNVPFMNLAMFLVKLALASIPAAIVLWMIAFTIVAAFGLLGLSLNMFRF
jgi:hypothetical protein